MDMKIFDKKKVFAKQDFTPRQLTECLSILKSRFETEFKPVNQMTQKMIDEKRPEVEINLYLKEIAVTTTALCLAPPPEMMTDFLFSLAENRDELIGSKEKRDFCIETLTNLRELNSIGNLMDSIIYLRK